MENNSELSINNDLISLKVTRYFYLFEAIAILLGILFALIRLYSIAIFIVSLSFIFLLSILIWFYFHFQRFPEVIEKQFLNNKAASLQAQIQAHSSKIENVQQVKEQLHKDEQNALEDALSSLQKDYIQTGLARILISDAKIPGIGPKLKERLNAHGVVSAKEINRSIDYIEGFGEAKLTEILNWRNLVYSELDFNKPDVLPYEQSERIKEKFQIQQATTEVEKQKINQDKIQFENELTEIQPRINQLKPITFSNYLRNALSFKGISVVLIIFSIILSQLCLGSSATIGAIKASIPTSTGTSTITNTPSVTFTSTSTLTSTITLTPTITNTPTITDTPTITYTPTITFTPTRSLTPTATLSANVASCVPQNTKREVGTVTKVVDGDTIDVLINDRIFRVRYIGMDTPEIGNYYYYQSTAANSSLVLGKTVLLVKDVSETDRYDRLLRYVFVENIFVNYELVKQGHAQISTYPPDVACAEHLLSGQTIARTSLLGFWQPTSIPVYNTPVVNQTPVIATQPPGNCDPAYPTVCIPSLPPDLDCGEISYRRFQVLPPDPHGFDGDNDGIGCESG